MVARTSKKQVALQAALEIIEEARSPEALTYDSLSSATGMSKSGLIYHFPTRHEMFVQLHAWSARRWELKLLQEAGIDLSKNTELKIDTVSDEEFSAAVQKALAGLSDLQKSQCLLKNLSQHEPLVELLLSIHASVHPDFLRPWEQVERRWLPSPSSTQTSAGGSTAATKVAPSTTPATSSRNSNTQSSNPLAGAAGILGKGLGGLSEGLSKFGGFKISKATAPKAGAMKAAQAPANNAAEAETTQTSPAATQHAELSQLDSKTLLLLLRVMATGLWAYDHVNATSLSTEQRQQMLDLALKLQSNQ